MWTHLDGKAVRGTLSSQRLEMVPIPQMTWGEWKASHPDTKVLSPDTPFQDRYRPVRIGVFNPREAQFGDNRLPANILVVGVEVDGQFKGYAFEDLSRLNGVANDVLEGQPLVVIYDGQTQTGLAYSRLVGSRVLEFYNPTTTGFELRDRETGTVWNSLGRAVSGPLEGESLQFLPSFVTEWYGWSGYHPDTLLFEGQ